MTLDEFLSLHGETAAEFARDCTDLARKLRIRKPSGSPYVVDGTTIRRIQRGQTCNATTAYLVIEATDGNVTLESLAMMPARKRRKAA